MYDAERSCHHCNSFRASFRLFSSLSILFFVIKFYSTNRKWGFPPPLFQVNKGELEPAIYSCFPGLNFRFKQVAFFTFGEAQPLQALLPDRLGGGKGRKQNCVGRPVFHPWLEWYQAVIYPLCASVFRTIKFSKKL